MQASTFPQTVKVVGASGPISLGKQFAGRQVLVEEKEAGVWLIRTATVIPDKERWLHDTQAASAWHVLWIGRSNTLHLTAKLTPFF